MIDPATETVLMLSSCKRQAGIRKSYRSLLRYVKEGVPVVDARGRSAVVRLAWVQLPNGIATSLEAYRRFIAQLTEAQS